MRNNYPAKVNPSTKTINIILTVTLVISFWTVWFDAAILEQDWYQILTMIFASIITISTFSKSIRAITKNQRYLPP